ncbi:MAG: hypothetical protein EXR08_06325 [Alphaproteobacteria bacterium]|nr:hypothetical protein [Alphaproteobacteria bacterium]
MRQVYDDFKNGLLGNGKRNLASDAKADKNESTTRGHKKSRRPRRAPKSEDTVKPKSEYTPSFNKNLDLAKLENFYDRCLPKNHSEKILIFSVFLRDELKIDPCTANDIYTCYNNLKLKDKRPTAFV